MELYADSCRYGSRARRSLSKQSGEGVEMCDAVADAAIANDVYVIIDWHSHGLHTEEAKEFFSQITARYKGVPNVIYEIFNEPVKDTWLM